MSFYQKHVFFCTNLKDNGRPCCQDHGASDMLPIAKQAISDMGLVLGPSGIRVSQSGCLGRCRQGPSVVIYPDNVWYTYSCAEDVVAILQAHLGRGEVLTRLLMRESVLKL